MDTRNLTSFTAVRVLVNGRNLRTIRVPEWSLTILGMYETLGCFVCLILLTCSLWIAPSIWRHANPIDRNPPKWGSSSRLSTPEGFLKGEWVQSLDESTARRKDKLMALADSLEHRTVYFEPDHRFTFLEGPCSIHGIWEIAGVSVELRPGNVDGFEPATISARTQQLESADPDTRNREQVWLARGRALDYVRRFGTLQLDSTGTKLMCPSSLNSDGTSFIGTDIWLRVKG